MRAYEVIHAKRDGRAIPAADLAALVAGFTSGEIPDYQMAAFCMAVFFRGMDDAEVAALTEAMLRSGDVLDLSDVPGAKVDKHSTGGVGDKVSLALAPLAAACGVKVPMISGRGLGHTGGTLDKLEAIPGFRTDLPVETLPRARPRRGGVPHRPDRPPRPGRQEALRAPRRDRDRGVDPAHRRVDHVEEARRGDRRARARREGRLGRVHEDARRTPGRSRGPSPPSAAGWASGSRRCSPTWTSRSGARSGTRSRSWRRWSSCAAAARPDLREVTVALTAEMLLLGGAAPDADGRAPARRGAPSPTAAASPSSCEIVDGAGRRPGGPPRSGPAPPRAADRATSPGAGGGVRRGDRRRGGRARRGGARGRPRAGRGPRGPGGRPRRAPEAGRPRRARRAALHGARGRPERAAGAGGGARSPRAFRIGAAPRRAAAARPRAAATR